MMALWLLIDWLIDLCLMSTLLVFQLNHGIMTVGKTCDKIWETKSQIYNYDKKVNTVLFNNSNNLNNMNNQLSP